MKVGETYYTDLQIAKKGPKTRCRFTIKEIHGQVMRGVAWTGKAFVPVNVMKANLGEKFEP